MQPIIDQARKFLAWLEQVEIPSKDGAVLSETDLHSFRKHADQLWQAWFLLTWECNESVSDELQTGYRAFEKAVYGGDLTGRMMLAHQCWEQQGNLPSFAAHDPWELAYDPSRLAAVRKALKRMVGTEAPPVEPPALSADESEENTAPLIAELFALAAPGADQVFLIAQDASKSSDDRMLALIDFDKRFLGYSAEQWGKLLNVSSAAIRKNATWKTIREKSQEE